MTLFVKGTDTALLGLQATADVIWHVSGISDDGYPILGEVELMQETPEINFVRGQPMYVTAEGDTYPANLVEDRRQDGSVQSPSPSAAPRPLTVSVAQAWRGAVQARRTFSGLLDWVDDLDDSAYLAKHGLYLNVRDHKINQRFAGAWQITEHYTEGTVTEDGNSGLWAIVGDDRDMLIQEAIEHIRSFWDLDPAFA